MNFSRFKMLALSAVAVVAAGGYYMISADAVQGEGELAQAPLNTTSQIPPAFIMAVDDSASMEAQVLFGGVQDGYLKYWDATIAASHGGNGFFKDNSPGSLLTTGTSIGTDYYLFPHASETLRGPNGNSFTSPYYTTYYAIPPLDSLGFARSHEYNFQYFNPNETYLPWLQANGSSYSDSNPENALFDPRGAATIKLTGDRDVINTNERFRLYSKMILPAGTAYYATSACGGLSATGNGWKTLTVDTTVTVSGSCYFGIKYFPAVFYLKATTPAPEGFKENMRILHDHAGGADVPMYKYEIKPENYSSTVAYKTAIQNFANWFTYYGNRNRVVIASMSQALGEINNMRVGYFVINQFCRGNNAYCSSLSTTINPISTASHRVAMRDMSSSTDRASLYQDLLSLPPTGNTPNLHAVYAGSQQFKRTDTEAPIKLACQKNALMLFTDGYSNLTGMSASVGNVDGSMGSPFSDSYSNTLADYATYYYVNNPRPDLDTGKVPVSSGCSDADPDKRLDCNSDPHVNFYGVTLGATGQSWGVTHTQFSEGYTNPPTWPAYTASDVTAIDDIWHAAVNTRGEYINAYTPEDVTAAMRKILASVGGGESPSGSIAVTGSRVGDGSLTVEPAYASTNNGTDWYGELTAYKVTSNAGVVATSQAWSANANLPVADARNIWYGVQEFGSSSLSSFAALCSDSLSICRQGLAVDDRLPGLTVSQAIAYLRGDRSLEIQNGGTLRDRTRVLGDIVNSAPVVSVPNTDDYGYRTQRNGIGIAADPYVTDPYSYASYLTTKQARTSMVYVGANDGMLHAFDGATGEEKFAYIPRAVLGHMGNLLFPYDSADGDDQIFQHRYYVDGPVVVSDAYYASAWNTVLVGTTGAGGRSVFALNISNPSSFDGARDRLWELDDQHANSLIADNIGHVLGKPVVVPVKDASGTVSWKAIFGNGYGSVDGRAVLFVVDIATGQATLIPAGSDTVNGLGNIIAVDRKAGTASGRDGYADMVYAVDLKGAVWRFDLSAMTLGTTTTRLATVTTPVFMATDASGTRQPITGGIEASAASGDNVMLYFGTGSFSFKGDAADNSQQTFYAVLDTGSQVSRSDLLQQSIISEASGARTISSNVMTLANKGWLLDLGTDGERFVGYPQLQNGIVFFTTFEPASTDVCSGSGTNWLYGLYSLNGGAALTEVSIDSPTGAKYGTGTGAVNTNTEGVAKGVGVMVSPRMGILAEGATEAEVAAALDAQCTMAVLVPGGTTLYMSRPCGRQSWRQLQ